MQGLFHFARHVAFIALVARALLPTGWMPDVQAGSLITICSVDGKKVLHPDAPAKETASQDCAFSAAPQPALAPDAPALAAPAQHAFIAASDRDYAAAILARFSPASPRAPPLNA